MADFPYLWVYENKETQTGNNKNGQDGNIYVEGDVIMNGESIFNTYKKERNRLRNIFAKKHELIPGVRPNGDWNITNFKAELMGTNLYIEFTAKAKKKFTVDYLDKKNVDVFDVTLSHYGYIKNMSHVSFCNERSGPCSALYTFGKGVNGQNLDFGVKLTSIGSDLGQGMPISAKFTIPVALNIKNFPTTWE